MMRIRGISCSGDAVNMPNIDDDHNWIPSIPEGQTAITNVQKTALFCDFSAERLVRAKNADFSIKFGTKWFEMVHGDDGFLILTQMVHGVRILNQ